MTMPIDLSDLTTSEDGYPAMDTDTLNTIIDQYLEDAPRHAKKIREGVRDGQWDQVRTAAHALRGASSHFKAVALVDCCATIEKLCKAGERVDDTLIIPLTSALREVTVALAAARQGNLRS